MNKRQGSYTYDGKLIYNDNAEYEVLHHIGKTNISKILNKIYQADDNYIEFRIIDGCKIVFAESGRLKRNINIENGLEGYFIDVYDLESALFNNTGQYLEIAIFYNALKGVTNWQRFKK